jgi:predicted PurR-regulated permease PerM
LFIPIALAILLSFVLAPLVRALQRWHVPRGLAVGGVVLLTLMSIIFALGGVIAAQVSQLAGDLPRYEVTMREKIKSLRGTTATSGTLERAADVLQDLSKELNKPRDTTTTLIPSPQPAAPGQEVKPIPVEVRQPPPTTLESIAALIAPLLAPLTTTGIIAIFVVFILLQREDLRNRFIKLAGSHDLQKTTAALDDAATRLSRLFLIQLALNTSFGITIGAGLWMIGVPSPVLWGILAAILRFVPYIGAFISAVFPLTLAAAVDPGWSMLLWTGVLFLVSEPVVGQVIEPLVYGHSTGLSPVAVVASATFWTAMWGPVGLVLATPLTVACRARPSRRTPRVPRRDARRSASAFPVRVVLPTHARGRSR